MRGRRLQGLRTQQGDEKRFSVGRAGGLRFCSQSWNYRPHGVLCCPDRHLRSESSENIRKAGIIDSNAFSSDGCFHGSQTGCACGWTAQATAVLRADRGRAFRHPAGAAPVYSQSAITQLLVHDWRAVTARLLTMSSLTQSATTKLLICALIWTQGRTRSRRAEVYNTSGIHTYNTSIDGDNYWIWVPSIIFAYSINLRPGGGIFVFDPLVVFHGQRKNGGRSASVFAQLFRRRFSTLGENLKPHVIFRVFVLPRVIWFADFEFGIRLPFICVEIGSLEP